MTATSEAVSPLWEFDREIRSEMPSPSILAGIDEAGRGPLAGNVVAACVILDPQKPLEGLNDSKKLTAKKRDELFERISEEALYVGVGEATPTEIDTINILGATFLAMKRAADGLESDVGLILVDGNQKIPELGYPQKCQVKGDSKSASIAAASILAKVTRDRQLEELHEQFPEYGFNQHKGYGTKAHLAAIKKHGMTEYHRKSFRPKALQTELFSLVE